MAGIPFRARISPFQWRGFPFARGFVPFNGGDSLSRAVLSLSMAATPFQRQRFPFSGDEIGALAVWFGSLARPNGTFEGENGALAKKP